MFDEAQVMDTEMPSSAEMPSGASASRIGPSVAHATHPSRSGASGRDRARTRVRKRKRDRGAGSNTSAARTSLQDCEIDMDYDGNEAGVLQRDAHAVDAK